MLPSLVLLLALALPAPQADTLRTTPDLSTILAPGFLVEDTAGDGHPDRILARVLVPATPSLAEVAAAANLAARLGFESVATDLGLLLFAGEEEDAVASGHPMVLVGRAHPLLARLGVEVDRALSDLVAGEGAVVRLPPSPALPAGGVWVAGADDTGVGAASNWVAGRYPGVWAPDEATLEALASRVEAALTRLQGDPDAAPTPPPAPPLVSLERVVVSAARAGVLRISATAHLSTPEALALARDSLDPGARGRELLVPGLHRLDLHLVTGASPEAAPATRLRITPERPWAEGTLRPWQGRDLPDLALHAFYSTDGIFRDTRQDLLPDRPEGWISLAPGSFPPVGGGSTEGAADRAGAMRALVDLATRIGHEGTGLRIPLVRVSGEEDALEAPGFPVLFGVDHFGTRRALERVAALEGEAELVPRPGPGEGFVHFLGEALGENGRSALAAGGADAAGLAAAGRFLAHRIPSLHEPGPGTYGLAELEDEVRRFFQARGTGGQVALALVKLDQWLDRLGAGERPGTPPSDQAGPTDSEAPGWRPGTPLQGLRVELAVDTVPEGLAEMVEARVRARLPELAPEAPIQVVLEPSAFGAGEEVYAVERSFPWEVDEVWEVLRSEVLPAFGPGRQGRIEVRVSEPPEVREALARAVSDSVAARGGEAQVVVLSAYKQGFSWIEDQVIPRLAGQDVARIEIEYRHLDEDDELPWQVLGAPNRFLQELFPVEEVLARRLGVADTAVVFRGVRGLEPTYRLRALGRDGELLHDEGFQSRYRVLPYFAMHPEYETVRVSTGWIEAWISGEAPARQRLVDRRLATDLDHFWDFWQAEVQPALRDYLMDLHEGRITPSTAPFFDALQVEVRLSEPNHRIGVDEEVISSLESLHNDLYFTSLALFAHLGEHYGVGALNFPGRILPWIDPDGAGEAGHARVTLTGRREAAPALSLRVAGEPIPEGDAEAEEALARAPRWRYALSPLPAEAPRLRGAGVRAGPPDAADPVTWLRFEVTALDSLHRHDEHRDRATEGQVDRTFLPVPLLDGMVQAVRDLHEAGILQEVLAFEGVERLDFEYRVERAEDFRLLASLPASSRPSPTRHPVLLAESGFSWEGARARAREGGAPMVQWETPIPPPESDSLLARIGAFPEARTWYAGRSFLGRPLWAADFLPPMEGRYLSRARLTALRPTVFLSGRQHANEVSSTSHLLRLGELLVTDPEWQALLLRVNVVLNPILNADGAQLAYDMQRVNPDFTLHAGYLGALGVDVTSGGGSDPLYPESRVRPSIQRAWLPDAFLNLHGYPSHEWVQHFSGYAAWVRGRTVAQRAWWAPRGWFIPGYSWVDDPDHPEIREAQFHILDALASAITSLPEVEAMNRRQYARYARYGRQDVEGFREGFHEGMLSYLSLRGRAATGQGPTNPRILTFSATTEAPDETARGAWLELVASAGLAHTTALLRYMAEGDPRVERAAEVFEGAVIRTVSRKRPVLPMTDEEEPGTPTGGP